MIKLGLCTIAFREMPIDEVLHMTGEIGFDGVEIWGKPDHMPSHYDAEYVKHVRDTAEAAGLEIAVFGSYIYPLTPQFAEASAHTLEIAAGLGTPLVRIWAPQGEVGSLSQEDYDRAVAQLKDFSSRAADRGLVLAIESHDNFIAETSAAMHQLLADVGAENLKVNWQASWKESTDDFYVSLADLMPHVVNVHAQNFSGEYKSRMHLSDGDVDYGRVVAELRKAGFSGYVEVEFVGEDDPVTWLKEDFATLKRIVAGG